MILVCWNSPLLLLLLLLFCSSEAFVITTPLLSSSLFSKFKQQQQFHYSNQNRSRRRRIALNSNDDTVGTTTTTTLLSEEEVLHPNNNNNNKPVVLPKTQPLSPHSFAGMVEQALIDKFSADGNVDRILESWRLLDLGYEHHEFAGRHQLPPIMETTTSKCQQHAHSYVPGLRATQFYNTEDYDWCRQLQSRYPILKQEFDTVTKSSSIKEGNNVWAGALTEDASSYGTGWKTLVLMDRGIWDPTNVNLFPETASAIRDLQVPCTEIFFASMDAHSKIAPHSDFTNFVVTSHLGLDVPDRCHLTIGDETRQWKNGELLLFDTSILHEAKNDSDRTRYILMLRVWHPDLTETERKALQFLYDALAIPELANPDPSIRFRAELELQAIKAFPTITSSKAAAAAATNGGGGGFSSGGSGGGKKKKKKKKKAKK